MMGVIVKYYGEYFPEFNDVTVIEMIILIILLYKSIIVTRNAPATAAYWAFKMFTKPHGSDVPPS